MKKCFWFILASLLLVPPANLLAQQRDSFTVYLFLLESCKITQAYTTTLQALHTAYAGDSIGFAGLFPNPVSGDSSVAAFAERYRLPFACTCQRAGAVAAQFHVTITPEVVVYNETQQKVLYQGRIDNMYETLGRKRRVITSAELEGALSAIRRHQPVPVSRTQATGCLLPGDSH